MISSTKTLPDGYRQTGEIDLSKNKRVAILLSVAGTILLVFSLILLGLFLRWARPELTDDTFAFTLDLWKVFGLFASILLIMLVHELIHGFFFWMFTRSQPVFALRPLYAYAAAPEWFIPASRYWIIGLAPLALISLVGLLVISAAPAGWIPLSVFLTALNIAGSVGDMFIVMQLLRLSTSSLVKDAGDSVGFFEPAKSTGI